MKRAVLFYSLTDNTREAAKEIGRLLNADVYAIDTIRPMPKSMGMQMMYGGMLATFGMCPKIKGIPENISDYDEIILGTPIWASKQAPAINTVLKNREICQRIVAVFTFSGGGDNDKCQEILKKQLPNLNHMVALADRNNPVASENQIKLKDFVEDVLNGERQKD